MSHETLSLGILAHVDAGKTTLTERLLHAAGVIETIGSVDEGTTQTDSLALERERGITIKAAVVAFRIGDVTVNLVDTPGHPDFVAEVERALAVLDGAVLVISAVEGVQPQTRVLMRALRRLRVPTLIFVNKIDRPGAVSEPLVESIARRLTPCVVPLGGVRAIGTRAADFVPGDALDPVFLSRLAGALGEHDDAVLARFVDEAAGVPFGLLAAALAVQSRAALVHPLLFGSALTGAGVGALMDAIVGLLPAAPGDAGGAVSGTVFKIERAGAGGGGAAGGGGRGAGGLGGAGAGGGRVAYVRLFSGTVHVRDRVRLGGGRRGTVTGVRVFDAGGAPARPSLAAGEIGMLSGLDKVRIGDAVGAPPPAWRAGAGGVQFAPPTLEAVVLPRLADDRVALRQALGELTEQDPLIRVRLDEVRGEIGVSLYGEVQREVIEATLARDYGLEVTFRTATPICVERPIGCGEAVEVLHGPANPFNATIGLRVAPAPPGSGVGFRLEVDPRTVPLYLYKTVGRFTEHLGGWVREVLREGLHGWEVTDCVVAMTRCTYSVADGPPSRRGPLSTPADFRSLTPVVLMEAVARARTAVCEPVVRAVVEAPAESVPACTAALARAGAVIESEAPASLGDYWIIEAVLPARQAAAMQRQLPELTGGEGTIETSFCGYQPVSGPPPTRPRTTVDPREREVYLASIGRRFGG